MPNGRQPKDDAEHNSSKQSHMPPQAPQTAESRPAVPSQAYMQPHDIYSQERTASDAYSNRSSPDLLANIPAFGPDTLLDVPADQHALNNLEGLHSQAGLRSSSATGLPPARSVSARTAPSRNVSSLSSSRAESAMPRPCDDTPDAVTNALTLQGMSLA